MRPFIAYFVKLEREISYTTTSIKNLISKMLHISKNVYESDGEKDLKFIYLFHCPSIYFILN